MSWLTEMRAELLIKGGWRAYATSINTRRRDLERILQSFIDDAFAAAEGRDSIEHLRLMYRSMQEHCQMVGDLAIAMRNYHREKGTLRAGAPGGVMPLIEKDDICGASLPVLKVRWLNDATAESATRSANPGR